MAASGGKAPSYNRTEEGIELLYAGKLKGGRRLKDDEVMECRRNPEHLTLRALAKKYGVSYITMWNCAKGYSYKHLNFRCPPRL